MSVLIKGMKMPTSCDGSCPIYDGEFLRCNITHTEPWLGHDGEPIEDPIPIPSDCPLIPVPPHGRLIDADAFEKENAYFWNRDFINPKYSETLADLVNAAPTILEAEVES